MKLWDIDQLKYYSGITESKASVKETKPIIETEIKEGARLIGTVTSDDGSCSAKVYRDSEWDQFFVKFERDGRKLYDGEDSDGLSYADSKEDAAGIAKQFIARVNAGDTEGLFESIDAIKEGYSVLPRSEESDPESLRYQGPLPGLEGPFRKKTKSGDYVTVYYDPKEGRYYNRTSDMYYSNDEASSLFETVDPRHQNDFNTVVQGLPQLSDEDLQRKVDAARELLSSSTDFFNSYDESIVPTLEDLYARFTKELQTRSGQGVTAVTEKKEDAKVSLLDDDKGTVDDQKKTDDRMGKTQDDETSVKVPAGLVAQIDKRIKEVEKSKDEFDKTKYMEQDSVKDKTIDCLKHFKELLTGCTVGKHKEANIYYAGLMSPIQHLLPANLVKFLHAAEEKYKPMDTSVYPQKPKSKDKPD